jgi:hypothetical protein
MPRWAKAAAVAVVVLLALLVASQLLLPGIVEAEVEDRVTEGGGTAEVTLEAVPALRLLFTDGERFEIDAEGLELDLDEEVKVFDRLDGFGAVRISIRDSGVGPFELETFELERDGAEPYAMTSTGTADPAELAAFGAENLGIPGGGLAGVALETLFGDASRIPIELDVRIVSADGETEVVEGDATVAGVPVGPLAELITSAVVARL